MSDIYREQETKRRYGGTILSVVENDSKRIAAILANVPNGVRRAVGSALARAGRSGRTVAAKAVTKEYAISQTQFKQNTRNINHFVKDDGTSLQVVFGYAGAVIPLVWFDTTVADGKRIQTRVKRTTSKTTLDNAFMAQMRGHKGVYERTTAKRFPVRELFGPATPQMMYSNEDVMDSIEEKAIETYEKRIDVEINRILNGYGG